MATININSLRPQLKEEWTEILDGLHNSGFWDKVSIRLARPNLGNKFKNLMKERRELPPGSNLMGFYDVHCRVLLDQLEEDHFKYRDLFNPDTMKIIWSNIRMESFTDNNQIFRYPSKGAFICELNNNNFKYGFFDAHRGSCGYNSCEVSGSYGCFYIGTWENIYEFSLIDKYRKIIDEEGFVPKNKL